MRFVALALFALVVGSVGSAAPVPKQKPVDNPDLAAMQGTWKLTDIKTGGLSLGAEFAADLKLTMEVRDNTMTSTGLKFKQRITNTFVLDTTASPRRMTVVTGKETDLDGKPTPDAPSPKTTVSIYKLDGDTLTIAGVFGDEKDPPKGFADKGVMSMTYTRVKK